MVEEVDIQLNFKAAKCPRSSLHMSEAIVQTDFLGMSADTPNRRAEISELHCGVGLSCSQAVSREISTESMHSHRQQEGQK
jgi:hypothetical protein